MNSVVMIGVASVWNWFHGIALPPEGELRLGSLQKDPSLQQSITDGSVVA
jgi:hypothetical protein